MKTPEQIAEDAAKAVLKAHGLKKNGSRDYITALGWEMGEGVGYELALREIVEAAIEADRAQRKVVNWDEAGQLVQAYHEAADSWSGIDRSVAAMEIVNWVEYALEGGTR